MSLSRWLLCLVIFSCICVLPVTTFFVQKKSETITLLTPIYDQFPQIVGQGHQSWSLNEHVFLRNIWSVYMQEKPRSWALNKEEWRSIRGKAWTINQNSYQLSINGYVFHPDQEEMNEALLKRVETAIDSSLDYGPSLIDIFVSKARASLLSQQLSYKVLFTIAALKSCGERCLYNSVVSK